MDEKLNNECLQYLIDNKKIAIKHIKVAHWLVKQANESHLVFLSYRSIANNMGVSYHLINHAMTEFIDNGFVIKHQDAAYEIATKVSQLRCIAKINTASQSSNELVDVLTKKISGLMEENYNLRQENNHLTSKICLLNKHIDKCLNAFMDVCKLSEP